MSDTPAKIILDDSPSAPGEPRALASFAQRFAGPVLIAIVAIIMAAWTWGTWADLITSSGRELYLPWQIAHGKVLYRDLPHTSGPFSQYFNALMFRLLGVSARTLIVVNLFWLAALLMMIWRLWLTIADRFAATVACLLVVLLFSFLQLTFTGGFNFALPYSHELTHGVILSFGAITALAAYLRSRSIAWLAITGGLLGVVFLTKAEVFLAVTPAVVGGASIGLYRGRFRAQHIGIKFATLFGAMTLAPLLALSLLRMAMPFSQAIDGLFGSFKWAFNSEILVFERFQRGFGVDHIGVNADQILICSLAYALLLGPALLLGYASRKYGAEGRAIALLGTLIAIAAGTYILYKTINFQFALAGLSLVLPAMMAALGATLLLRARDRIDDALILQLTLVCLSVLLLVRMGLRVVLFEYGFAIAMPATLLMATAAICWLPRAVDRAGGFGWVPRAASLLIIAIFVGEHLRFFATNMHDKPIAIGEGADTLYFDKNSVAMRDMLARLDEVSKDGQTLAVLPEGELLNYYSGLANPTGYVNLSPPEMLMFGRDNVLAAFRHSPPDWIVLTSADAGDYGFTSLSHDYGRDVWNWVRQNYTEVATTGNAQFAMKLYRKRADVANF